MSEKIEWKIVQVAIKDLKENERNPRQIEKEVMRMLGDFIGKFGLIDKPVINTDLTIIGGHQRIRILKKNKERFVECWAPNRLLTDKEIDELCIGLNLHQGRWDFDVLANEWEPLDLLEYGFTQEQLLGECEQVEGSGKEKTKKKKECPNCGHQF